MNYLAVVGLLLRVFKDLCKFFASSFNEALPKIRLFGEAWVILGNMGGRRTGIGPWLTSMFLKLGTWGDGSSLSKFNRFVSVVIQFVNTLFYSYPNGGF